jgi:DNA invertase Pin-like site-specific DNA recombinase
MLIGYARTSTLEQVAGFEAQRNSLHEAGCEKTFAEQISSIADRKKLKEALDYIRDGDVLVVTKLDRLARSLPDLLTIIAKVERKGASLRILAMNLDTTTATGKLMLNVLGSVAEFERSMMLERQKEGIAKAKADGKYKGRAPTAKAKAQDVLLLYGEGIGVCQISKQLGISRSSVWRILRARLEVPNDRLSVAPHPPSMPIQSA